MPGCLSLPVPATELSIKCSMADSYAKGTHEEHVEGLCALTPCRRGKPRPSQKDAVRPPVFGTGRHVTPRTNVTGALRRCRTEGPSSILHMPMPLIQYFLFAVVNSSVTAAQVAALCLPLQH